MIKYKICIITFVSPKILLSIYSGLFVFSLDAGHNWAWAKTPTMLRSWKINCQVPRHVTQNGQPTRLSCYRISTWSSSNDATTKDPQPCLRTSANLSCSSAGQTQHPLNHAPNKSQKFPCSTLNTSI